MGHQLSKKNADEIFDDDNSGKADSVFIDY